MQLADDPTAIELLAVVVEREPCLRLQLKGRDARLDPQPHRGAAERPKGTPGARVRA